jgi:hypothetical protein
VSKRFYVDGRAQYLKVNISNLDGSLGIYELDVLYRYRPNVSFAVGYSTSPRTSHQAKLPGGVLTSPPRDLKCFQIAF